MSNEASVNDPLKWMKQEGEPPVGMDPSQVLDKEELSAESDEVSEANGTIELKEFSSIATINELKQKLQSGFANETTLQLDFSQVEKIDGATIQTLMAAKLHADKESIEIKWEHVSDDISRQFGLMGLILH